MDIKELSSKIKRIRVNGAKAADKSILEGDVDSAYDEGYALGHSEGLSDGYVSGYDEGHSDGYYEGYDEGHSEGYNDGYEAGVENERLQH